jgi:hypothetical protein
VTETEEALMRAAADSIEKVRTCHERVSCPRCSAPIGAKCRSMPLGWVAGLRGGRGGRELLHAHKERWQQEVPAR